MTVARRAPEKRRADIIRRIIISVLLAFAVGLLIYAVNLHHDPAPPIFTNEAVEATYPNAGDLDLRQARIGIDLKSGYTAELELDGTPIPKDQVEVVVGLDQYFYQPGPGTATGALSPGRHCATANITKVVDPTNPQSKYTWCFQVH